MAVVVGFTATVIGAILVLWFNIRLLRRRVRGWQSDFTPIFVFSVGSIDPRKVTLWTDRGFSETDAQIIVRQQLMCLLELPIGFLIGCALSLAFVR
jgi:hypothetical protein